MPALFVALSLLHRVRAVRATRALCCSRHRYYSLLLLLLLLLRRRRQSHR